MRLIAGALLLVAAAVCAAGYEIAAATHKAFGRPLPFMGWVFGLTGVGLMAAEWLRAAGRHKSKKQGGR